MDAFDYSQTMKDVEYFLWHELADHYIEMIKGSIYEKKNMDSIKYTFYTIGLGTLKLFATFIPHITEEIYSNYQKSFEKDKSIHVSAWPEPTTIDEKKEIAGEFVKNYVSQIRAYKSGQGIALNADPNAIATYASKNKIAILKANDSIIKSTLKFSEKHKFIAGKPNIEEKIVEIKPNYSLIGPKLKSDGIKIIKSIKENQEELIHKIEDKGDIPLSDFFPAGSRVPKEKLIQDDYIEIKWDIKVKGKKDSKILSFDGFYLELKAK